MVPLLREYVVTSGWVSLRDFFIGFALIQAFSGPNFNFAVYLGALTFAHHTAAGGDHDVDFSFSFLGALLAFIEIFAFGMLL